MVHFRFRLCVLPVFVTAYDPFLVCIFFKCSENIYAYMNCASQKCGNITRRPLPANQCVREATSGAHLPQSPQRPFAENLLTNGAFDWQLAKWQTGIGQLANGKGETGFCVPLCSGAFSWKFMRSMAIRGFLASTASTSTPTGVHSPESTVQCPLTRPLAPGRVGFFWFGSMAAGQKR